MRKIDPSTAFILFRFWFSLPPSVKDVGENDAGHNSKISGPNLIYLKQINIIFQSGHLPALAMLQNAISDTDCCVEDPASQTLL